MDNIKNAFWYNLNFPLFLSYAEIILQLFLPNVFKKFKDHEDLGGVKRAQGLIRRASGMAKD